MRHNEDRAYHEREPERRGHGRHGGWHHGDEEGRHGGWYHGDEEGRHGGWHHGDEEGHRGGWHHGDGEGHRGGWRHGDGEGRHGGKGGRGGRRGGGRGAGYAPLCAEEGTHLLMIGSYSCTRHKGEERMALQQEGKLSFLCLQEIDWITGDYLPQIEEAAAEVAKQFHPKKLILFGGCQVELQSLDTKLLTETLTTQLGIPVEFHRGCHLVGYGDALNEKEGEAR